MLEHKSRRNLVRPSPGAPAFVCWQSCRNTPAGLVDPTPKGCLQSFCDVIVISSIGCHSTEWTKPRHKNPTKILLLKLWCRYFNIKGEFHSLRPLSHLHRRPLNPIGWHWILRGNLSYGLLCNWSLDSVQLVPGLYSFICFYLNLWWYFQFLQLLLSGEREGQSYWISAPSGRFSMHFNGVGRQTWTSSTIC